jgi:hypothetical protein
MYVRVEHLQTLHYFYFAAAIFNFSSLIITGIGSAFSYYFVAFCAIHMLFAWYITWVVRGSISYYVKFHSLWFMGKHILIAVIAVLFTVMTWLVGPRGSGLILWYVTPHGTELFGTIAYINYLIFFMTVIWYALFKSESISGFFRVYNSEIFHKAKRAFITARSRMDIRGLSSRKEVETYRYGSDSGTDRYMVNLPGGDKRKLIRNIRVIDVRIYRNAIASMREKLQKYKAEGFPDEDVKTLERMIKNKERKLEEYIRGAESIAVE